MEFDVTEEWLGELNRRFRNDSIPPAQRPWLAWVEMSKMGLHLTDADPRIGLIFKWFEANTQRGSQIIGPAFRGVFSFDQSFWPFDVPMVFGHVRVDLLKCLRSMPESMRQQISQQQDAQLLLRETWESCSNFAYGSMELRRAREQGRFSPSQFYDGMMIAAERQLNGAVSMLLSAPVNSGAIEPARMSVEMFQKAFLAATAELDDAGARLLGHNLEAGAVRCLAAAQDAALKAWSTRVSVFPRVADRYGGLTRDHSTLWECCAVAQGVAGAITRLLVTRFAKHA